jgi:DNA-binding IclR family transcriptional regulator
MTRDEIIQMAREAGFTVSLGSPAPEKHVRFYALATAKEREARQAAQIENEELKARLARADLEQQRAVLAEREACAKVCDGVYHQHIGPEYGEVRYGIAACAAAIRARKDNT